MVPRIDLSDPLMRFAIPCLAGLAFGVGVGLISSTVVHDKILLTCISAGAAVTGNIFTYWNMVRSGE